MLIIERVQVTTEWNEFIGPAILTHAQLDAWMGYLVFDGPNNPSQFSSLDDKLILLQPNKTTLTGHVDRILGDGARLRITCPEAD